MFKFKSRASAPIIYFDADAKRILAILGKDATEQGIITVAQIPAAIAALDAAIAAEDTHGSPAVEPASHEASGEAHEAAEASEGGVKSVSLRQRAQPFLQLLQESLDEKADVVWGV